jgi:3-hydroxyisobutyrate dehydrogenase
MAKNLLKAGYPLTVYNRSPGPAEELAALGAKRAYSPKEVAEASEVVITMVRDSPDVEEVILGDNGVIEGARVGTTVIDMSTISPEVTRRIAARLRDKGVNMLDAPVSGGEKGAIEATLSIMVGGPRQVYEKCLPILKTLGKKVVYMGDHGAGQTTKLCNQVIGALNILGVCEGLLLAAKAGLDLEKVVEVIGGGASSSWALINLGPKMVARDFRPGFKVGLKQKDLRLALATAAELELPLPGTALVHQLFRALEAEEGGSDKGTQALIEVLERLAGFKISG